MTVEGKKVKLICPNCYKVFESADRDLNIDKLVIIMAVCPECDTVLKVLSYDAIDAGIAKTIALLNKKGYPTKFCCEGHDGNLADKGAYIYFKRLKDEKVLRTNPLPDSWTKDRGRKRKIFGHRKFIIRSDYDIESRLEDIYKWAESLPDKGPSKFYYEYSDCLEKRY